MIRRLCALLLCAGSLTAMLGCENDLTRAIGG